MRGFRGVRSFDDVDGAARVLAAAVAGLPENRQGWGRAMRVELDHVVGGRERWRFSLGCAWAAAVIRAHGTLGSKEAGGEVLRVVLFSALAASAGLVAFGLGAYPDLRADSHVWSAVVLFLGVLFVYGAVTLVLSRGISPEATLARRYGLLGGVVIGGSWLAVLSPAQAFKGWVALPLVVALFGPACVAGLAARKGRTAAVGTRAALWSGLVGGLGVFIVWVTTTYANDGRPYDAGMLRDFRHSQARDLATYAVSDNLGSGLVLLLLIPTVAFAVGSLTAQLASGSFSAET